VFVTKTEQPDAVRVQPFSCVFPSKNLAKLWPVRVLTCNIAHLPPEKLLLSESTAKLRAATCHVTSSKSSFASESHAQPQSHSRQCGRSGFKMSRQHKTLDSCLLRSFSDTAHYPLVVGVPPFSFGRRKQSDSEWRLHPHLRVPRNESRRLSWVNSRVSKKRKVRLLRNERDENKRLPLF
jgi:hypothetical protein